MSRSLLYRLGGLVSIVLGLAIWWFFLLLPLQRAQAGVASRLSFEPKVFALVPLCLVFGAIFVLVGDRWEYRKPDGSNLTASGWAAFAVVAVLSALGFWWFSTQFTALIQG